MLRPFLSVLIAENTSILTNRHVSAIIVVSNAAKSVMQVCSNTTMHLSSITQLRDYRSPDAAL